MEVSSTLCKSKKCTADVAYLRFFGVLEELKALNEYHLIQGAEPQITLLVYRMENKKAT